MGLLRLPQVAAQQGAQHLVAIFSQLLFATQPGSIVLLSDTSSLEAQNLSSGGDSLAYVVVDGVVYGFTGDGDLVDGVPTTGVVFTLTVGEDGSWEFDLQGQLDMDDGSGGTVTLVNEVAQQLLGCPDGVGKHLSDVVTLQDRGGNDWFTASARANSLPGCAPRPASRFPLPTAAS